MLPVNWLKDTLRARRAGNMLLFVGSGPLHATAHRLQRLRMCAPKRGCCYLLLMCKMTLPPAACRQCRLLIMFRSLAPRQAPFLTLVSK